MKKTFEYINKALNKFVYFPSLDDEYFNFIYPFTTENINGYISQLNIEGKNILTVCGSGDHVLNLILNGAKKIDTFDISPLTKYYLYLKIGAIKALKYDEYLEFFCYLDYPKTFKHNKKAFNIKTYWKISNHLDKYTKIFWDNLYLEFSGLEIRKNDLLFSRDEEKHKVLKQTNNYLNPENFYRLKNILKNKKYEINFYNSNITELPKILKNKYDLILTSNISQNIQQIYNSDENISLERYKKLIVNLSEYLNENGKILIGYFYDIRNSIDNQCVNENISCIYNFPKLNNIFDNNLEYLFFNGTKDILHELNGEIKDSVAIYKKI